MANDVQVFDGFRYEIEPAQLWNSEKGEGKDIIIVKLIDDARGVEAHAYFPLEGWAEFKRHAGIAKDVVVAGADELRRLGI